MNKKCANLKILSFKKQISWEKRNCHSSIDHDHHHRHELEGVHLSGQTPAPWPALLVDHRNCSAVMIILSQLYLISEGDNIAQFVDDPFEKSMFFAN